MAARTLEAAKLCKPGINAKTNEVSSKAQASHNWPSRDVAIGDPAHGKKAGAIKAKSAASAKLSEVLPCKAATSPRLKPPPGARNWVMPMTANVNPIVVRMPGYSKAAINC